MQFRRHVIIFSLLVALIAALLIQNSPLARSQAPTVQRIESDDASVTRAGHWTSQIASQASSGSYLYSSGADDDVLTLQFSGPSLEVMYIAGPSLGTLAINVDGTVLRTVITAADETHYGQVAKIDYLSDEPHILKVYAQEGGIVGIDAFVVQHVADTEAQAAPRNIGWMATYIQRFPPAATCSLPTLNLSSLPSGSTNRGTYPVSDINFDWGNTSGPVYVAPTTDLFAIQFERTLNFSQDTTLTISYMADDGIRMYDNGTRFVDNWGCSGGSPTTVTRTFTAGVHDLIVQYVENTGYARVAVIFSVPQLIATPQSGSQIELSWNDPLANETNYRVERLIGGTWAEIATLAAGTTSYTDTNLGCNTSYNYRVRGYFSGTNTYSGYSNIADALTGGCITGTPTDLTAQIMDYTQMQLTWVDNAVDETDYRIEMSHYGFNWQQIGTAPANATTYTQNDLVCEQNYTYRIRAYRSRDGQFSDYSNLASADTIPCFVIPPVALTATTLDDGRIQLDWSDYADDETEFRVERSPNGTTDWLEIGTAPANTITYTDVGLTSNTTYYYRVRAYRVPFTAYSDYSEVANATTAVYPPPCDSPDPVHRVSIASDGTQGNNLVFNSSPRISADGRYVVFASYASNLISGDTNGHQDIFVHDRWTCQTSRVSVATDGTQGNGESSFPTMSSNGRYIFFDSIASNLVSGDTNGQRDIFAHDRITGLTMRVSVASDDTQSNDSSYMPEVSSDGRYVVYHSNANNLVENDNNGWGDVFVYDGITGTTTRVSVSTNGEQGNSGSHQPIISADGRYVAFGSYATNLVTDDTNGLADAFVHDRITGTTTRVSVATDGTQANYYYSSPTAISTDGRYVLFISHGTNLVQGDTNGEADLFIHDLTAATTTRVSIATDGTQGNDSSYDGTFSPDGRIWFGSYATNLVAGDTNGVADIFVRDLTTGETTLVSYGVDSGLTNGGSFYQSISEDGRYMAFFSFASNLVNGDTNGVEDMFVRDLLAPLTPPLQPSTLTTTAVSASGINLNWADNSPSETEYRIERSPDGLTNWGEVGVVPANTITFTNSSLACGTAYHYRVRAYRASDTTYSGYSNVATTTTHTCPPAVPTNLTAAHHSQTSILLVWIDNANDETHFGIERSPNGTSGWSQIGSTVANVNSFTDTVYLACGTTYHYRVRSYRSGDGVFSGYSNITNANTAPCRPDALALVNPATRSGNFIHTLTNPPAGGDYSQFATGFPYGTGGQYVTGDWNGDGLDTLALYRNGAFFYTNQADTAGTWVGIWFGLGGQPVVGRFDATINHDCLGVTDSGTWTNGDTYFALYFTCNLTSGPTPPLTFQWLSILLPNSQGFTGTHQFVAGDFNGDGVDSVAVRRGAFIAWTNVPPTTLLSQFNLAQYIGAPGTGDEGKVVTGDWDSNYVDSFGLVYQNGTFYRRNDVEWNTGVYILQTFTSLVGTPFDVASWQPN